MNAHLFFSILICTFLFSPLSAQRFVDFGQEHPISGIRDIDQDTFGFLWLGTRNGLVKYDGYSAKILDYGIGPTYLSNQYVEAICISSDGLIYAGTRGGKGLEMYDRDKGEFTKYCLYDSSRKECIDEIDVFDIVEDLDHQLWVSTNTGLFHFDPKISDTLFTRYTRSDDDPYSLSANTLWKMHLDRHGTLWVGSVNGLNRYDREKDRFINNKTNENYFQRQTLTIKDTPNGKLWVSMRNIEHQIFQYNPDEDSFHPVYDFPPTLFSYFNFDFDQQGQCWIGCRGAGVAKYIPQTNGLTSYNSRQGEANGLGDVRVQVVFVDKFDNVWLGGSRLHKFPSSRKNFQNIKTYGHHIRAIHEEEDYLIYSHREPIIWDKRTKEKTPFWTFPMPKSIRPSIPIPFDEPMIYEFKKKDQNTLVFTTVRNVYSYDQRTQELTEYPQNNGGMFQEFVFGNNDDIIISEGNHRPIVFSFKTGHTKLPAEPTLAKALYATSISRDSSGYIWLGPDTKEIYKYDPALKTLKSIPLKFKNKFGTINAVRVTDIAHDSDRQTWVGTEKGVWQINEKDEVVRVISKADGLYDNMIKGILPDEIGNIWVSTERSIAKISIADNQIYNYTSENGLLNSIFTGDAYTKGGDGVFYFGGTEGIDYFDPKEIGQNKIAPIVRLKKISVNGKELSSSESFEKIQQIKLAHHQNYIDIDVVGIHFTSPSQNKYAYKINDQSWVQNGTNRRISLTNTSPGKYAIFVKSANEDGYWSEEKNILNLEVTPPWWRTKLFYLMSALSFFSLVFLIYRYRVRQIKTKEAIQTKFNKQIAEIEMKALRAQMNPHFIFNSLNSVKSLIAKEQNVKATTYLTRFSQLLRKVLNNSRVKFVRLMDDLRAVELYLGLESLRFGDSFEYKIEIEENVNPDFVEIPPMLLQPYIENAIWHGLLHKENGLRKLNVRLSKDNGFIKIVIEDNGIGRAASAKMNTRSSSKNESLGMQITQDRLKLLEEIYGTSAQIEINDLISEGVACGTRVVIKLPDQD